MLPAAMSTFLLSPEHEELRRSLRRFAEEQVAPYAAEADERSEYPWKSFEGYRQSGFLGIPYPAEHGGDGADGVAYAMLVEEVARVCASSALFVLISRLACGPIIAHGSAELAARVVPRVVSGEWQGSYCLSEPNAGSDVGCDVDPGRARRRPLRAHGSQGLDLQRRDLRLLHGLRGQRSGRARRGAGSSAFVVERDRPGLAVGKLESKMGMRGSPTGELLLEDVVVPAENRIGEENGALRYAFEALDGSRPIVGAQAVGIAQGALDVASRYVKERRQFDTTLADFQGVQFMLADMATRVRGGSPARVPGLRDG